MSKKRGTSNAPLVVGIIGGALGLPASVCSGACAGFFDAMAESPDAELTKFYLGGTLIVSVLLIIFSCFTKKAPIISGILMLLCTIFGFVLFGVTWNVLGVIAMILTLIAAILSMTQKKEIVE